MKRSHPDDVVAGDISATDLGFSDPSKQLKIKRKGCPEPTRQEESLPQELEGKQETTEISNGKEEPPKQTEEDELPGEKADKVDEEKPNTASLKVDDAPSSSFTASLATLNENEKKGEVEGQFSTGASKTSLFGNTTTSSLFGGASLKPASSLFGPSSSTSAAINPGTSLFMAKPTTTSLFSGSSSLFGGSSSASPATTSLFGGPSTLSGPFGVSKEESDTEAVENTEKEVIIDNDEDGFDNIWLDKAVGLFANENGKFRNRGAGVLKVLRKQDGDVKDRVVVFRKRGTKQLLLSARLADNFVVGCEAKDMGGGMKGVLFSSVVSTDKEQEESTNKPDQFILKFKIDANRKTFLGHVKQAKD